MAVPTSHCSGELGSLAAKAIYKITEFVKAYQPSQQAMGLFVCDREIVADARGEYLVSSPSLPRSAPPCRSAAAGSRTAAVSTWYAV